jgi:hypothetical protein
MVFPLVGRKIVPTNGRPYADDPCTTGIHATKWPRHAQWAPSGRTWFKSGELFEEAHVSGVEVAYVGDAMLDHGYPLDAHSKGEASDLFRVVGVV